MSEAAQRDPSRLYIGCAVSIADRPPARLGEERRDGAKYGTGDGQISECAKRISEAPCDRRTLRLCADRHRRGTR